MPLRDDSRLESSFQELLAALGHPGSLNPAQSDPLFYFVYPPERMLAVKRRLVAWMGTLHNQGFVPRRVSLATIMRKLIDESGRWEAWLEIEAQAEPGQLNESVRDVLTQNNALANRVAQEISGGDDKTVVLLTEAELLHPYFRTRALEGALIGKVPHPTVLFYPGRRLGQYGLRFLGFYPEDPNYRSTIIGGLE